MQVETPEAQDPAPTHHSRLRAKREERLHQRRVSEDAARPPSPAVDALAVDAENDEPTGDSWAAALGPDGGVPTDLAPVISARVAFSSATGRSAIDDARRRQRAEARRLVIDYAGTVWDVIRADDLRMLDHFFLVEGPERLLRLRSKEPAEAGRTLLHTAAWAGRHAAAAFLLARGAEVNAIDLFTSQTTPLMDAARAGHADVCALLLTSGADASMEDAAGDTALHWAARRKHGLVLLTILTHLDHHHDRPTLLRFWTRKNGKGRTPMALLEDHPCVLPMLRRRFGDRLCWDANQHRTSSARGLSKRKSRLPASGALLSHEAVDSAPGAESRRLQTPVASPRSPESSAVVMASRVTVENVDSRPTTRATSLRGVQALGLDVGSFAYKSRESGTTH